MDSSKSTSNNILHFSPANDNTDCRGLADILADIKKALHHLLETNNETIIDLTNYPCDEQCENELKAILGKGDVTASLNIFGSDSVIETAIHGVWWVHHLNNDGEILTKAIYVSYIPSILPAQREDIEYAINVLSRQQTNNLN